jgi:hypothetical protein
MHAPPSVRELRGGLSGADEGGVVVHRDALRNGDERGQPQPHQPRVVVDVQAGGVSVLAVRADGREPA